MNTQSKHICNMNNFENNIWTESYSVIYQTLDRTRIWQMKMTIISMASRVNKLTRMLLWLQTTQTVCWRLRGDSGIKFIDIKQ